MKAQLISDFILTYFDNKGDLITNKKLQKLLYYIEAWNLVHFSSIIDEDFEAWVHGPVIPSVYHEFKEFGYSPLKNNFYESNETSSQRLKRISKSESFKPGQYDLCTEVLDKYGALASFQLELLSHSEAPWQQAREGLNPISHSTNIINKGLMKNFYSSMLDE